MSCSVGRLPANELKTSPPKLSQLPHKMKLEPASGAIYTIRETPPSHGVYDSLSLSGWRRPHNNEGTRPTG